MAGLGYSNFLIVNGCHFPTPVRGFEIIVSTTVNAGRNANNAVVGQRVGRDLFKLNNLEWKGLKADTWRAMLNAISPYFVPVIFEHPLTGSRTTVTMYPGDRTGKPLFLDSNGFFRVMESGKFNLIDCGW